MKRVEHVLKGLSDDKIPLAEDALDQHIKRILFPQENIRGNALEY